MKLILVVISLLIAAGSSGAYAESALTLATPWPKNSYEHRRALAMAKELGKALGKAPTVQADAEHGLPVDRLFQATRSGLVPMAEWVLDQAAVAEPVLGFNNLPVPADDFADAKQEFARRRTIIARALGQHGLELLLLTPWEPPGLFSQRAPTSLAAVSSYRVKVYDPFGTEFVKKLGGEPHQIGFSELDAAFKRGRVNAVLTSPSMALAAKIHNRTMYFTELKLALPVNAVVIGRAYFQKLSPLERQQLRVTSKRLERVVWQQMKKRYQKSLAQLKTRGMMISDELPEWLANATDSIAAEIQQSWHDQLSAADAKQLRKVH